MKQDKQPRRASKKDMADDKRLPASDMNTRAKGGDKESHEPLRAKAKGSGAQTSPSRRK